MMMATLEEEAEHGQELFRKVQVMRDHSSEMAPDAIAAGDEEGAAQWASTAASYGIELLLRLRLWTPHREDPCR